MLKLKKMAQFPKLTEIAVSYPKTVILLTLAITLVFLFQIPKIKTDTDPKNMLPATSAVRVYNDRVEKWFGLHKDMIVLGIVNEQGIFNQSTLEKIARITEEILRLKGVSPVAPLAQGPSAEEIMKMVEDRYQGDDFQAQVTLETTDELGQTKTLLLDMKAYLYDKENANYKVLIVVVGPEGEETKGLAFLAWENEYPKPDDRWLYLPSLKAVKRIEQERGLGDREHPAKSRDGRVQPPHNLDR